MVGFEQKKHLFFRRSWHGLLTCPTGLLPFRRMVTTEHARSVGDSATTREISAFEATFLEGCSVTEKVRRLGLVEEILTFDS
jgi:hypothetical protein